MPVVSKDQSRDEALLASSKIDTFEEGKTAAAAIVDVKKLPVITPRTDFAIRQANHLVERICRENGVEAPKLSFSKSLNGQEDQISAMSAAKHLSVLRLAEYLHKRGQIERDYALGIQKLNRQLVQTGDTDERLGQLIVMGEKTAAGHMDWARKIGEERIIDDLKSLCAENEEQRRYLHAELKKFRATWSKAVSAFEKVRKNRDKALKAADSAQLALDSTLSRRNASKGVIEKLQEDVQRKSERARVAREEYNRAMSALTAHQTDIFKVQIPQCYEGFEKMERARIAAVRTSMINLAQVHLAVSNVEIESGQRWLKSLVSLAIDDEIELFIRGIEERAALSPSSRKYEDNYEIAEEKEDVSSEEGSIDSDHENEHGHDHENEQTSMEEVYSNSNNLTQSESNLLMTAPGIEDISDPETLTERRDKLENLQSKLRQQLEALKRMEEAYSQQEEVGNESTLEAVRMSMNGIAGEIEENSAIIEQIEEKLCKTVKPFVKPRSALEMANPMSSILEELNRLDQRRATGQTALTSSFNAPSASKTQAPKKKSLSRSFEDILSGNIEDAEDTASPKATETQWTQSEMSGQSDYYCAEEDDEVEELVAERRSFRNRLGSADSAKTPNEDQGYTESRDDARDTRDSIQVRRKSVGQSTPASSAITRDMTKDITNDLISTNNNTTTTPMIPRNRKELFKVQALYNFIGRKETDELDLRTGEILSVFEGTGEWWEAENEAGVRGYIPFNYVIRINDY